MIEKEPRVDEIATIKFLQGISGLGPVRFREIYEEFGSFVQFIKNIKDSQNYPLKSSMNVRTRKILGLKILLKLLDELKKDEIRDVQKDFALHQLRIAQKVSGHIITYWDASYPKKLYQTNQSVPILYGIGDSSLLNSEKSCAVVGTRSPTDWTRSETGRVVEKFVRGDYVIVSGLAKGVDAISHQTAIDNYGSTIAVLGCGPDVYYPKQNRKLQERIRSTGLIISEYPFGSKVTSLALKKRNKIVVGLSDFVCITETSATGGTMNSYLAAIEQKKPVRIFLPISNVGGDFSGNLAIFKNPKAIVQKVPTESEPNLYKLRQTEALIFDLDGTLWESRTAIIDAMKSFLQEKGKKTTHRELEKKIDELKSPYKVLGSFGILNKSPFWKIYEENLPKVTLYSTATQSLFSRLVDEGLKIGVVTSCKGQIAKKLLKHFQLNQFVSAVISPSNTRARKPSPIPILMVLDQMNIHPKKALFIGDEEKDIQAAHRAGCIAGLAAWNKSEKINEKADFVFSDIDEINIVRGLNRVLRV